MRTVVIALFALITLSAAPFVCAQDDEKKTLPKPPAVKKVHVGFQAFHRDDETAYKVGLWTPVYVTLDGGTFGIEKKGDDVPYVEIQTVDSEDVGTRIRFPVLVKPLDTVTFMGYVKAGRSGRGEELKVTLYANNREFSHPLEQRSTLGIDGHLYLTLGSRFDGLHKALRRRDEKQDENDVQNWADRDNPRQAVFENKVERLPDVWFGYNSIDLMILSTENAGFLTGLNNSPAKIKAIAQWVRRGGRLVVPVNHLNQQQVHALLSNPAWDPPIPVVPPARGANNGEALTVKSLPSVATWGAVQGDPLKNANANPVKIATLDPGRIHPGDWEVEVESESGKLPLIAQVRYGLGRITYLAFSLEDPLFRQWNSKDAFLRMMLIKLAPKAPAEIEDQRFFGRGGDVTDISTELLAQLDNFDVKVIPFGYVALFIVLYILVVGPLDFFLLKYVFKRLEWTWITFPAVVLGVSVIAYFAAYALKGRDLKINKVDVVDIDMRTTRDDKNVHAYGHTFFTILSPRIQNYTIGVEPDAEFWGERPDKVRSVDLMGWMGRPSGGPHEMGRSGSSGFFRKPYTFREDARGIEGVPIPVWTTKAFSATWEETLPKPPLVVDLKFHTKDIDLLKISGKIENHLGVDLVDVWLLYSNHCYPIAEGLKSVKNGGTALTVSLRSPAAKEFDAWAKQADEGQEPRAWTSNPTNLMKRILFQERVDTQHVVRNHLLRPIDVGWRIQDEQDGLSADRRTREAILFARVRFASGPGEELTKDSQTPLPTKIWLGGIPEDGKTRPELIGHLNQDTYIRVFLPVQPAAE
jgi:hypothetical protein